MIRLLTIFWIVLRTPLAPHFVISERRSLGRNDGSGTKIAQSTPEHCEQVFVMKTQTSRRRPALASISG